MNKHTHIDTVRTVDLDHEQLLVLDDFGGTRARILFGGAWLTEQGRWDDRFARAGDELHFTQDGRAVVEAIGRTRVELVRQGAAPLGARLGRWIAAWLSGRRLLLRGVAGLVSLALALGLPDLLARGFLVAGSHPIVEAPAPARVPLT